MGVGAGLRWQLTIGEQASAFSSSTLAYWPPTITDISGTVLMRTNGSELVVLTGTDFGPVGGSVVPVRATYGASGYLQNATGCLVTVSDTEIQCMSAPGVGFNQQWVVVVGQQSSVWSGPNLTTSYIPPAISFVGGIGGDATSLPTNGSLSVFVFGSNFGPALYGSTVFSYGPVDAPSKYTLTGCVMTLAHTTVTCRIAGGVGKDLFAQASVGGQIAVSDAGVFSYALPTISSVITLGVLNTRGGGAVYLHGTNFGPMNHDPVYGIYGPSGLYNVTCQVTAADVAMTCLAAPGVGSNFTWQVVVGWQYPLVPSVNMTSYAAPVLKTLTAQVLSTAGNDSVVLTGDYFGPIADWNVIEVEYTSARSSVPGLVYYASCRLIVPHTVISCSSAPGVGTNHKWRTTIGNQTSGYSNTTTSYRAPYITYMNATEMQTVGGEVITISGTDFGPMDNNPVNATYRGGGKTFIAVNCAVSVPHYEIQCLSAEGSGLDMRWTVNVGLQFSTSDPTVLTSYANPFINTVRALGPLSPDMSPLGGSIVQLNGTNFGPNATYSVVSVSYTTVVPALVTYVPANCSFAVPHVSLLCVVVPGAGHSFHWTIVVANASSPASAEAIAYATPTIHVIAGPPLLATVGNESVEIFGVNFGPPTQNLSRVVSYNNGLYLAQQCVFYNDSYITCRTAPGIGAHQSWAVIVANQTSSVFPVSQQTSYFPPHITSTLPVVGPWLGGQRVVVTGSYFGTAALGNMSVQIGGVPCVVDESTHNHTYFECDTGAGPAGLFTLSASTGDQTSNSLPFNVYEVRGLSHTFGPYDGGTAVYIYGVNFVANATYAVEFGSEPAASLQRVNATTLFVHSPNMSDVLNVTSALPVYVSVNGERAIPALQEFTFYLPPEIFSVLPVLGPVSGHTNVSVAGVYYDTDALNTTLTHTSGVVVFPRCVFVSTAELRCVIPPLPLLGGYKLRVSVETDADSFQRFSHNVVYYYAHADALPLKFQFPAIAPVDPTEPSEYIYHLDVTPLIGVVPVTALDVYSTFVGGDFQPSSASYVLHLQPVDTSGLPLASVALPSDVSVIVHLNTSQLIQNNTLRDDCTDIDFWTTDTNTRLSYWFQPTSCNQGSTTFWVRTPG